MQSKLTHIFSLFLLLSFLAAGFVSFNATAQSTEAEIESEIYLRTSTFSHVLAKKERVVVPDNSNSARQILICSIEQFSLSAQIAHAIKGNSLYLLNNSFLI